jgi:hypothetical protein
MVQKASQLQYFFKCSNARVSFPNPSQNSAPPGKRHACFALAAKVKSIWLYHIAFTYGNDAVYGQCSVNKDN